MWADRYLQSTLQLKILNNIGLARVLTETLKISANTKYYSSVEELIRYFSLPKLRGTCRIFNNI